MPCWTFTLHEIPTFCEMAVPSNPSGITRQKTRRNFSKALNNSLYRVKQYSYTWWIGKVITGSGSCNTFENLPSLARNVWEISHKLSLIVIGGINPDLKRSSQAITAWHYITKNRASQVGVLNPNNSFRLVICYVTREDLKFLQTVVYTSVK